MAQEATNNEILNYLREFYVEFSEFKEEVTGRLDGIDQRLDNIEQELRAINDRLDAIEQRLGKFDYEEYEQFRREIVDLKVRVARLEEQHR